MTATTQRPPRARKPATAPFSPAAAKLIQQIQAEAREQLLVELSAKDSIIVLHGFEPETKRVRVTGDEISLSDDKGNNIDMYREREEPEAWRTCAWMQGRWHPSYWYGNQTRVDANGVHWTSYFATHVCDDFGNLVQVAA